MVGFKNRYLVMEVFVDPAKKDVGKIGEPIEITQSHIAKTIRDSILSIFGECGLALSINSFQIPLIVSNRGCAAVKYANPITKICIVRTSREDYRQIWAAITMVRSIEKRPVVFNLLDLSGSIKACKNAALKCDELKFEQYKLQAGDDCTADTQKRMQNCLEKIKLLEH